MKRIIKIIFVLFIVLMGCACSRKKLYSESYIIDYLNAKYNTEFVILERNKINRESIEYTLALKNDESVTFKVKNEIVITGSDIGPKRNYIIDFEIADYFKEADEL